MILDIWRSEGLRPQRSLLGYSIVKVDTQWDFAYDGDGSRVKQVVSTYDPDTQDITGVAVTAYFMGGLYEVTDNKITKYYSIAGMTVAMYDESGLASMARAVEVAEARLKLARLKASADRPARLGGGCDECKRGIAQPEAILTLWAGADGCGESQRDGFWVYGAACGE